MELSGDGDEIEGGTELGGQRVGFAAVHRKVAALLGPVWRERRVAASVGLFSKAYRIAVCNGTDTNALLAAWRGR